MSKYHYEITPTGFYIQIIDSETNRLVAESWADDEHDAWNWAEKEIESWSEDG